jgi:hypothetical protein
MQSVRKSVRDLEDDFLSFCLLCLNHGITTEEINRLDRNLLSFPNPTIVETMLHSIEHHFLMLGFLESMGSKSES